MLTTAIVQRGYESVARWETAADAEQLEHFDAPVRHVSSVHSESRLLSSRYPNEEPCPRFPTLYCITDRIVSEVLRQWLMRGNWIAAI
jgi:hypothetical protein